MTERRRARQKIPHLSPSKAIASVAVADAPALPHFRLQLLNYFEASHLDPLSSEQQQAVFKDLQTRPLLLALVDVHGLGVLLSYERYISALNNFRPSVQQVGQALFNRLRDLMELAEFRYHSGYRLHISEVIEENTPVRMVLKVALEEIGIGFKKNGRLMWPVPDLMLARLRGLMLPRLPVANPEAVQRAAVETRRMDFFELLITQPGTWVVQLAEFCAKRTLAHQTRMYKALEEDGFFCVNLSLPACPSPLRALTESVTRLCFFFCNPVPLSYWTLVAGQMHSKLRTVLFVFEPALKQRNRFLTEVLQDVPRLELEMNPVPVAYRPDFDWDEGLFSPVFLRPRYYQNAYLTRLDQLPDTQDAAALPPLAWIDAARYGDVVTLFAHLVHSGVSVKFLTGTRAESNCIWRDCLSLLGSQHFFVNQTVSLAGDPLGAELSLREINTEDGCCTLYTGANDLLGNNFQLPELEAASVAPIDCLVHRHYNVVLYYTAVFPIDRSIIYKLTSAAYQKVLIISAADMLHHLD